MKVIKKGFTKKFKLGNKGFTLVEILAAVVILGILTTVAIVSVSRAIERAKKNHYITQEKNMVLSAQSYFSTSKDLLPKSLGQQRKVTLGELQTAKVIDKVLDYSKNECNSTKSYVKVVKYTDTKYSYAAYLECDQAGYQSDRLGSGDFEPPTITFAEEHNAGALLFEDQKIKVTYEDNSGILSYSYTITKILNNNKKVEVKNSGVKLGNTKKKIVEKIDLTGNIPGTFSLVFEATDIYGNKKSIKADKTVVDNNAPTCGNVVKVEYKTSTGYREEYNNASGQPANNFSTMLNWKNVDRRVTIKCTDKESGCTNNEFTQEFTKDAKRSYIKIVDNQGNTKNCPVYVFIDKTKPEIDKIKNPNEINGVIKWTNKSFTITIEATDPKFKEDKGSGVDHFEYAYPTSSRERKTYVKSKYEKDWDPYTSQKITSLTGSNEPDVTFTTSTFSAERYMDVNFRVCDKAGNCSCSKPGNCSGNYKSDIRIDKTPPSVSSISNPYEAKWINKSYSIKLTVIDNSPGPEDDIHSDVKDISYKYDKVGTWNPYANSGTNPFTKGTGDNKAQTMTFDTTNFVQERNDNVKFKVCDHAGNCSTNDMINRQNSKIQIDKTQPVCNNSGGTGTGNSNWVNFNIELFGHCSDPNDDIGLASGCTKPTISRVITDFFVEGYSPGTVYDNAGNKTDCPKEIIQIDKEPPLLLTVENPYEGKWINKSYAIRLTASDNLSGIRHYSYRYPTSTRNSGSESNWTNYSNSAFKTTFTTTDFTAERNMNVNFQVCDWAGNCSGEKSSNIKIDKTNPKITSVSNPYEATWINKSYSINLVGEDPYSASYPAERIASGISKYSYNYKSSENVWHDYASSNTTNFTTTAFSRERNEKVTFKICDVAGNCVDNKDSKIQIDKTAPTCGVQAANYSAANSGSNSNTNWSNGGVNLTGTCTDASNSTANLNSGCKSGSSIVTKATSDSTTTSGTNIMVGTVYDNAGNSVDCKRTVYIDRVAPTCTPAATNGSGAAHSGTNTSSNWSNTTVSLTGTCSDTISGCASGYSSVSKTRSDNTTASGTEVNIGTVKDKAGNTVECKKTVYLDKTAPTCSVTATNSGGAARSGANSNSNWSNKSVDFVASCTDNISQCTKSSVTSTYSTETSASGTNVGAGTITDRAGNSTNCTKKVYIDKTAPTCTVSATNSGATNTGANSSSNWSNSSVSLTGTCSDSLSKCTKSSVSKTYSNNTTSSGTSVSLESVSDNAGNTKACSKTVYIDKTAPSVTINYPMSGSNAYKYTGSASDGISGLTTQYRFIECSATNKSWSTASSAGSYVTAQQHYTSSQSYRLEVKDKAGNIGQSACKSNYVKCGSGNTKTVSNQAMIYRWNSSGIVDRCSNTAYITEQDIVKTFGSYITGPYVEIPMDIKYCNCKFDKQFFSSSGASEALCSSSVGSDNPVHQDGMAIIVYQDSSYGKSACTNRSSGYARYVCERSIASSATGHHGVYFYTGNGCSGILCLNGVQSYTIPFGRWLHNGADKTTDHKTQSAACEYACKNKVTSLS